MEPSTLSSGHPMPCSVPMQIGIFGATGPAGSALGVRLASVGFDVVLGSRQRERAEQVVDDLLSALARPRAAPRQAAATRTPPTPTSS